MSEFRKLVEAILKENDISEEIIARFQSYINELNKTGQVQISDEAERNAFSEYCYNHYEELPFDPDEMRPEGDLVYLV